MVTAILFVLRPGANGLRKRIVTAISLAVGRRVDVQWVKLRLLPQPGFDLENFVVYDDPAFSAEPMLQASEVTATLRLRSLVRGRIEIGRLTLKEPSFNLVRNDAGHWNVASLVERAARTPAAPTSAAKGDRHPVFPYIEGDTARINFRIGAEKKSYALTDAEFALWLESPNQWGMRMRAVPVRTDFNLTDTGILSVNGTWLRSTNLQQTPMKMTVQWTRGQLGQVTKLFYGTDKGWRGELTLTTVFAGTPANLQVNTQAAVQDFRRYDIVPSESLRLSTSCNATYSSPEHVISQILCVAPVGQGMLSAQGSISAPTGPRSYELNFSARDVPIQAIAALARRAKKDLPQDLSASGTLDGDFSIQTSAETKSLQLNGTGEATAFHLISQATSTELDLGTVPFEWAANAAEKNSSAKQKRDSDDTVASIGPFSVKLGKGHTVNVRGTLGRSAYRVAMTGDAEVKRLLQAAQTIGIHAPQPVADGNARLSLQIAGSWSGFAAPEVTGTADLSDVRAETRSLNGPVEIASASVALSDTGVRVSKLHASGGGTNWTGSLSFPRRCQSLATCPVDFDLQADTVAFEELHAWLTPQSRKRPWYRFLSPSTPAGPPILLSVNATGKLQTGRLLVHGVKAANVSTRLEVRDGKLNLSDVRAELLGGTHDGSWQADLSATPPTYSGSGSFEKIVLDQVSEAMHDGWVTGTGQASYEFATHGSDIDALLANAALRLDFDARSGQLPHIRLADGGSPVHINRFTGRLTLQDGSFHIERAKLETPSGNYIVSGTASTAQKLDVLFTRSGTRGFSITGTLSSPRVAPANLSETRAALKE